MQKVAARVLVVETSKAIRSRLVDRLTAAGLEVIEVETGTQAICAIILTRPDAVVMGIQLPNLVPLDGVRLVRGLAPAARLVVLSTEIGDRERALASGADHVLEAAGALDQVVRLLAATDAAGIG